MEPLLTPQEAADFLRMSVEALRRLSVQEGGPPRIVISPKIIRYRKAALEEWLHSSALRCLNLPQKAGCSVSFIVSVETDGRARDLSPAQLQALHVHVIDRVQNWILDLDVPSHLELEGDGFRIVTTATGSVGVAVRPVKAN